VLLVSANKDAAVVYHALQQGAAGFLPKESARSEIVDAILECAKGHDVVAPALATGLALEIRRRDDKPPVVSLSPRELEVLSRIAQGQPVVSIARDLTLSQSTVKTLVQRTYDKLGVADRASAVAEAMRQKLLE
jgi:two-component system nitrate/nitrite response regulator NarL